MKREILPLILLSIALSPLAQAGGDYGGVPPGKNYLFVAHRFNQENIANFDIDFANYKDLNEDGDFADANERILEVDLNGVTTCVGASAHLACDVSANVVNVIFKAASTLQTNNSNYSLTVTMHTSPVDTIHRMGFAITFRNDTFCQTQCQQNISENVSNRVSVNLTSRLTTTEGRVENNITDYYNRTIVNLSASANRTIENVTVRVDQNLTTLENNLTVIDSDGERKIRNHTILNDFTNQQNTSRQVVENVSAPFEVTVNSGSGGGSTASDPLTILALVYALVIVSGILIAYPSIMIPIIGIFVSTGLLLFLWNYGEPASLTQAFWVAKAILPVFPLIGLYTIIWGNKEVSHESNRKNTERI